MNLSAPNRELSTPGKRYDARLRARTSSVALQRRVIEHEQRHLTSALDEIEAGGQAVRAAALIVAKRRRFIGGTGKSYAYATLLAAELSEGLSNVSVVSDPTVRPVDVLADVRDTDVLITFSFRRYGRETVDFARAFTARGGSLVTITDDADAPVARYADVAITVSTESVSFTDSPTAVCALVHLLSTLTTASAKGARRRLAERDAASEALGMYVDSGAANATGAANASETATATAGGTTA